MNIYFHTGNIDVHPYEKEYMANRMNGLDKFFRIGTHGYIDIEKTRASHHGTNLYYVSVVISDARIDYFTEEYSESIREAFDRSYGEIFRIIRDERSRSRTLIRKAGQQIKNLFRRH
jgi:ribosome-associated translation inhibitor RaiA